MDDLLKNTESFSLGDDGEVQKLKRENERLRSKLAQLQSNDAVSIGEGRANIDIPFEDLEMDQQIGGGGFSLVYRAMYKGTPVAVKRWFNPDCTDVVMQEFREEVLTLRDLRHPHVVQLIGACMRPPNLCIVLVRLLKARKPACCIQNKNHRFYAYTTSVQLYCIVLSRFSYT
eukprot:2343560-Pyramimonas_sp.AAC.1